MSGNSFVKHLKTLGYPEANKLNPSDYDWMYENPKLNAFLQWFTQTNNENYLSDDQVTEFNSLLHSEGVLTGTQLSDALQASNLQNKPLPSLEENREKVKILQDKLKKRKQWLEDQNTIKTSLTEELHTLVKKKENLTLQKLDSSVKLRTSKESLLKSNGDFNDVVQKINGTAEEVTKMGKTLNNEKLSYLLCQQKLDQINALEVKFDEQVKIFIENQLLHKRSDDETEQLIKTLPCLEVLEDPQEESYKINSKKILHLSNTYPDWKTKYIKSQCISAEEKTATKLIHEMTRNLNQLPKSMDDVKTATWDKETKINHLKKEIYNVEENILPGLLEKACENYLLKVATANHKLKEIRQNFHIKKQEELINILTTKLARGEWLLALLDVEKQKCEHLKSDLSSVFNELHHINIAANSRLKILQQTKKKLHSRGDEAMVPQSDYTARNINKLLSPGENCEVVTYSMIENGVKAASEKGKKEENYLTLAIENQGRKMGDLASNLGLLESVNSEEQNIKDQVKTLMDRSTEIESQLVNMIKGRDEYKKVINNDEFALLERDNWVHFYTDPSKLEELLLQLKGRVDAKL